MKVWAHEMDDPSQDFNLQSLQNGLESNKPLVRCSCLIAIDPNGIVASHLPVLHKGPVVLADVRKLYYRLLDKLYGMIMTDPTSITVVCDTQLEGFLKHVVAYDTDFNSINVVGCDVLPKLVKDHEDYMRRFNDELNNCAYCQFGEDDNRPCLCKGLIKIPGITETFIHDVFKSAQEFWIAKPWLRLRMNHVMRIDVPGSEYKFVQVLGGTGCSDVAIVVYKEWEHVQNEFFHEEKLVLNDGGGVRYVMVKAEFTGPTEYGGRCWADIDYMEEQMKKGTPLALMDPKSPYPDPEYQKVLPDFRRYVLTPRNLRNPKATDCE
ncbi:hypothetical protein HDU76_012143, partial [Blyttiomyces sp. JEL0837]